MSITNFHVKIYCAVLEPTSSHDYEKQKLEQNSVDYPSFVSFNSEKISSVKDSPGAFFVVWEVETDYM